MTALHYAARENHLETAIMLIRRGADVNAPTKIGWRPLHLAVGYGHRAMAKQLLRAGARIGAQTDQGWQPLHVAAHAGDAVSSRTTAPRVRVGQICSRRAHPHGSTAVQCPPAPR